MKCLNCDIGIEKPKRKFCSHLCGSKYWNKNNIEKCEESYNKFLDSLDSEEKKDYFKKSYHKFIDKLDCKGKAKYFKMQYEKYGEKHTEYLKELRRENPEKWKEMRRKKRLHEVKDKEKYNARRWDYLKRKDKCEKCGSKENLEFHHTDYKNHEGITLCVKCHRRLHNTIKMGEIHNGK